MPVSVRKVSPGVQVRKIERGSDPYSALNEQHPSINDKLRWTVMNLTGGRREVAQRHLQQMGFDAVDLGYYDFAVRERPPEGQPPGAWYRLDPRKAVTAEGGIGELGRDISDAAGGFATAAGQAVGHLAGAGMGGPGGSFVGGSVGAGAAEGLLGAISPVDFPEEEKARAIQTEGAIAAGGHLLGAGVSKLGRGFYRWARPPKAQAGRSVASAAAEPVQPTMGPAVRAAGQPPPPSVARGFPPDFGPGGATLRRQVPPGAARREAGEELGEAAVAREAVQTPIEGAARGTVQGMDKALPGVPGGRAGGSTAATQVVNEVVEASGKGWSRKSFFKGALPGSEEAISLTAPARGDWRVINFKNIGKVKGPLGSKFGLYHTASKNMLGSFRTAELAKLAAHRLESEGIEATSDAGMAILRNPKAIPGISGSAAQATPQHIGAIKAFGHTAATQQPVTPDTSQALTPSFLKSLYEKNPGKEIAVTYTARGKGHPVKTSEWLIPGGKIKGPKSKTGVPKDWEKSGLLKVLKFEKDTLVNRSWPIDSTHSVKIGPTTYYAKSKTIPTPKETGLLTAGTGINAPEKLPVYSRANIPPARGTGGLELVRERGDLGIRERGGEGLGRGAVRHGGIPPGGPPASQVGAGAALTAPRYTSALEEAQARKLGGLGRLGQRGSDFFGKVRQWLTPGEGGSGLRPSVGLVGGRPRAYVRGALGAGVGGFLGGGGATGITAGVLAALVGIPALRATGRGVAHVIELLGRRMASDNGQTLVRIATMEGVPEPVRMLAQTAIGRGKQGQTSYRVAAHLFLRRPEVRAWIHDASEESGSLSGAGEID